MLFLYGFLIFWHVLSPETPKSIVTIHRLTLEERFSGFEIFIKSPWPGEIGEGMSLLLLIYPQLLQDIANHGLKSSLQTILAGPQLSSLEVHYQFRVVRIFQIEVELFPTNSESRLAE